MKFKDKIRNDNIKNDSKTLRKDILITKRIRKNIAKQVKQNETKANS